MELPKLIISASRRTDLPGFHAEWMVDKLKRIRRSIHSIFFWTKHPQAFLTKSVLKSYVEKSENPFLLLTITGLGGSRFEPDVPSWEESVKFLNELVTLFKGEPERLRWRFDPVLPDVDTQGLFERIAPFFAQLGIRTCIVSLPSPVSLKGNLCEQYNKFSVPTWEESEIIKSFEKILHVAEKLNIKILSCATPKLLKMFSGNIFPSRCIDAELASKLHPRKFNVAHVKDPSQRKNCFCSLSEDIGSYTETKCYSGCIYCYSKAGGPDIQALK